MSCLPEVYRVASSQMMLVGRLHYDQVPDQL
jgi:hypothetical protein